MVTHRPDHERIYEGSAEPDDRRPFPRAACGSAADRAIPSHWYCAPDRPGAERRRTVSAGGPTSVPLRRSDDRHRRARARRGAATAGRMSSGCSGSTTFVMSWSAPRAGRSFPTGSRSTGLSRRHGSEGLRVEETSPVAVLDGAIPKGPGGASGRAVGETGLLPGVSRELAAEQMEWIREAKPRFVDDARAVVLPNRMEIDLPDVGPATIRIARNTYPLTEVRVDGAGLRLAAGAARRDSARRHEGAAQDRDPGDRGQDPAHLPLCRARARRAAASRRGRTAGCASRCRRGPGAAAGRFAQVPAHRGAAAGRDDPGRLRKLPAGRFRERRSDTDPGADRRSTRRGRSCRWPSGRASGREAHSMFPSPGERGLEGLLPPSGDPQLCASMPASGACGPSATISPISRCT